MVAHEPVMVREVVHLLVPERGGVFLDCTIGLGGHARALLEAGATRIIGIDRDAEALALARSALGPWAARVDLVHADFRDFTRVLDERGVDRVDGAVADLGVSSLQLDGDGRGFSFRREEPLDMRMDRTSPLTARDLVASADERELADVIFQYGEERHARRIARAIVEARRVRPICTTADLASIVRRVVRTRGARRIDPATRTFQALRIWLNRELDGLDRFLRDAIGRLREGARFVVIAFHSLEDRIVKHTFRALERGANRVVRGLTKRPLVPQEPEIAANPRARSAKLRAVERLS
jgi:16S rRNA (cytosine1402-N4)-methyltransferase